MASVFSPGGPTQAGTGGLAKVFSTPSTVAPSAGPVAAPPVQPVTPTFDPKIEANALYGKAMALFSGGFARIGASPAPIVGPYLNDGKCSFIVSFGLAVPVTGNRKIYAIYLDNEKWWSSVTGWDGSGALPGDSTFHAETADIAFRPGTLTQSVLSLETTKFSGDENAYRPQMLLQMLNLPYARFMANTGKPVPYVACDIGDVTGGAVPADGINLGTAIEHIAHSPWPGYTSSTFEAINITDVVPGILIKDNFTVVQLCQSITRIYRNINLLQSDKLRIKDHGSNVTPDLVLGRDTIVAADIPIAMVRADASGQKREWELLKVDPDQDYTIVPSSSKRPRDPFVISAAAGKETITLPVIMTADIGQAMVTFAQYYEENARKQISGESLAYGYQMEPGDLLGVIPEVDGIDNEIFLVTETDHGANLVVGFQARAILRCSLFSLPGADPYFLYVVLLLGCEGADGSTTFTDESPSAHGAGTVLGNLQVDTAQFPFGTASAVSDGTNDGLSFADHANWDLSDANGDAFTIEVFAKLTTSTPTSRALLWQGGSNGTLCFFFWIDTAGELAFSGFNDGSTSTQFIVASTGITWATTGFYHFAVTKDAFGKVRLFRDGVMVASSTPASSVLNDSNQTLRVGTDGSNIRSWPGWWKEARITKGICRYPSDGGFTVPTAAFPRS